MGGTTARKGQGSKMDPVQLSNFWTAMIHKEERAYGPAAAEGGRPPAPPGLLTLSPLGAAMVPRPKGGELVTGHTRKWGIESFADSEAHCASGRKTYAGSVAGSAASYPRTPQFSAGGAGASQRGSQAGSKAATNDEITERLAMLEYELLQERARREVAEREMLVLLSRGNVS